MNAINLIFSHLKMVYYIFFLTIKENLNKKKIIRKRNKRVIKNNNKEYSRILMKEIKIFYKRIYTDLFFKEYFTIKIYIIN